MAKDWKTVRVFISSTFRDMHAERDHLVTVVFPELRERLSMLGLELYDVDLRWGVPELGVDGEKANSWEYCKKWIDEIEPFFVSMLGQRYGYEPPGEDIPDDDDRNDYAGMSITEMEIRHAVLSGKLRKRSLFYLRETEIPKEGTPPDIYERFVDEDKLDRLAALKGHIRECGQPVRDYPCRWTGEDFTDFDAFGEMVLEDLWSGILRDERFVPKDAWKEVLDGDPDKNEYYTDDKKHIPEELWKKIVEAAKPEPPDPLDAEAEQMATFAGTRLRFFHGRSEELGELRNFVDGDIPSDESRLCVVRAVAGQGKSALLAKFVEGLEDSPHLVLAHYIGATERSADVRSMLERLVAELDRNGIPKPDEEDPKQDLQSLKMRLEARLGEYDGDRRIVLIIDAVNQLTGGHTLEWLPNIIGPNVRIILSCIDDPSSADDSPEAQAMKRLNVRKPLPRWVDLRPLDEGDVREIATEYFKEYCKELDQRDIDAICAMEQARNPLYLLVMLHELRNLGGDDMHKKVPGIIADMQKKYPDTVKLFGWGLERLEVFGKDAVELWCIYLMLGRVGMSSRELCDLLDRKFGEGTARTALRIERGIRKYLQHRGPQWDFFHGQLRQAAEELYMPKSKDPVPYHRDIAEYLETRWRIPDPHALSEMPYHQTYGQMWDGLEAVLTDLDFVDAKSKAGMVYELISDYNLAMWSMPEGAEKRRKEEKRQQIIKKYTDDLIAHAKNPDMVPLPDPPPAVDIVKSKPDIDRKKDWTPFERVSGWNHFVSQHTHRLGKDTPPAHQLAWNYADNGPVIESIEKRPYQLPWLRLIYRPPYNPQPACLKTLEGHTGTVYSIALTPDGKRAVSGSGDNTVRVWDVETGECLKTLGGHTKGVSSVALTPDGKRVVSGSADDTLRVWDVETGECLKKLEGHTNTVYSVAFTPGGKRAVSGSYDNTVRVWDVETGECLKTLKGHTKDVSSVALTPDGKRAVSGSEDKTVRVWDVETGECLKKLEGHTAEVESVALTPDGKRAVSGSWDETVRVWDVETGECLKKLEGHTHIVESVALTPDGKRAVSGGHDDTLRVWDVETGKCLKTLEGHGSTVRSVTLTPDGKRAVSGSGDKTLRVWDVETGECLKKLGGHTAEVESVALTPDGKRAVSGSDDKTVRVWDVETGECLKTLEGHTKLVNSVALTPDGKRAVSGGRDETVRVWDVETGGCLKKLEGHTNWVNSVALTPDGKRAVSGSDDKTLRVWDIQTGECLKTLEGHTWLVTSVALTPDGKRMVSGSGDKTLRVWDVETGECLKTLEGHTHGVNSVALTPDGKRVVSGSDDPLRVWDIETGECLKTLEGHTGSVTSVALTPDGKRVVSGSYEKTLRVWDIESGECLAIFPYDSPVHSVALYNDIYFIGTQSGTVAFIQIHNLPIGPPILTPWHSPVDGTHAFGCVFCRKWSEIEKSALGTELDCPKCGKKVKLNPFTIDADWRPIAKAWGDEVKEQPTEKAKKPRSRKKARGLWCKAIGGGGGSIETECRYCGAWAWYEPRLGDDPPERCPDCDHE